MHDLQRGLIIWERWALKCGMRWALSKGKSEVLLPPELALQYKTIPFAGVKNFGKSLAAGRVLFAGDQIKTFTQARYLGVVLSANGILECSLKNRIQMPHASLSTLHNAKLLFRGVDRLCYISLSIQCRCITRLWPPAAKILPMLPGYKSAAIADYPSTSDVQQWHIRDPSENVGQRCCWKTHEHSGRWSCNIAAEAPSKEDPDSLGILRSIPAHRTIGHPTAEIRCVGNLLTGWYAPIYGINDTTLNGVM